MKLLLIGILALAAGTPPRLRVNAQPAIAFSPAYVCATVTLVGGIDSERWYCPGIVYQWGDGSVSGREGDCPAYAGDPIPRAWRECHSYGPGEHVLTVSLRKGGRSIASATAVVHVL